jgi:hypothetical protein
VRAKAGRWCRTTRDTGRVRAWRRIFVRGVESARRTARDATRTMGCATVRATGRINERRVDGNRAADRELRVCVLGRSAKAALAAKPDATATAETGGDAGLAASTACSAGSTAGAMTASAMAPAVSARRGDGQDSSASVVGPGHSRESHKR